MLLTPVYCLLGRRYLTEGEERRSVNKTKQQGSSSETPMLLNTYMVAEKILISKACLLPDMSVATRTSTDFGAGIGKVNLM